jgi:lipoprotein-anchoring transpeptidase ErfK/SrfK
LLRTRHLIVVSFLALAACDRPDANHTNAPQVAGKVDPVAPAANVPFFEAQAVDTAAFQAVTPQSTDRTPAVLRAQILLDRAQFRPGVIDGRYGENVRQAVTAFQEANGLPADGQLTQAVFDKLTTLDARPVLTKYAIAEADVAGPFIEAVPKEVEEQSKLPAMSYTSPIELLAEKFHMTEDLLKALNPGVDFAKAGQEITVADLGANALPGQVASIEVDKAESAVKAFDKAGKLIGFFPATIGSDEMQTPDGELKVTGVSKHPTYTFDPARLTYKGPTKKTVVAAGPNNPVGVVWIGLNRPTFGIHGAPDPALIGKRSSHGCVRLTNWDALELAAAVKPGVVVKFTGGGQQPVAGATPT